MELQGRERHHKGFAGSCAHCRVRLYPIAMRNTSLLVSCSALVLGLGLVACSSSGTTDAPVIDAANISASVTVDSTTGDYVVDLMVPFTGTATAFSFSTTNFTTGFSETDQSLPAPVTDGTLDISNIDVPEADDSNGDTTMDFDVSLFDDSADSSEAMGSVTIPAPSAIQT